MSTYLIYSTICLGILLLVYYAILYNEKTFHFNRVFLLFSLIFSLTIPLVPVGINGAQINFSQFNKTDDKPVPEAPFTITNDAFLEKVEESPAGANEENSSSENKHFVLVLSGLYVTVVIFLFIRLLRITHMIQLKARRNPGKVYKGYRVVLLNEDIVPHTFLDTIFVSKKQYISGEIDNKVLLHEITHAKQSLDQSLIKIILNSENEIIVKGEILTLAELHTFLDEQGSDSSKVISLRVSRDAEFGRILDIQNVLRIQGSRRINYTTK